MTPEAVIERTRQWITQVVVGCNFCPFAARELKLNSIHWEVHACPAPRDCLEPLLPACARLDGHPEVETSFLIFPGALEDFEEYLELVAQAERLMRKGGYEGVYQLASFHPLYRFADAPADDPANYTNRSPYPMFHLLREASITRVLANHPDPDQIPRQNVAFARARGLAYMRDLLDSC